MNFSPNFSIPIEVRNLLNKMIDIDAGKWERIANNVELFWGRQECHEYLIDLMKNDEGIRRGFPLSVSSILLELSVLHSDIYTPPPAPVNVWNIWE